MPTLTIRNPATGSPLHDLEMTPLEALPALFAKASTAQASWAKRSVEERAQVLLNFREILIERSEEITDLLSRENGKPRFEAMVNELFGSIELITFFAKKGPKLLRDEPIPMGLMKHRKSYLNYWPLGVIAVITPWNYPFLLPMGEIVMGLLAGNGIIFKPSEITPLIGIKIQELAEAAGVPKDLLITVIGDGRLGSAMIEQKPAKIFFTGSVSTGKKIMAQAAQHLIPVNLELGGKDPMIVLPDADLDYATSAALWGGFSNSGQVCASVERIIVHESIAEPFTTLLKSKLARLRQGPTEKGPNDLGAITFEKQKDIYERQILEAREKGATFITGGSFSQDRRFLQPTLVTGKNIESLEIYNEETFGPVVALTTFKSIKEAIEKANRSPYGLLASVITRDLALAESVARRLEAGTVTINEVVYTAGLPETPWGGIKNSGFGRKHSARGLLEFVNTRHIHKPVLGALTFKSLWWFPYTPYQYETFKRFMQFYRLGWGPKVAALPGWLLSMIRFITKEPRI